MSFTPFRWHHVRLPLWRAPNRAPKRERRTLMESTGRITYNMERGRSSFSQHHNQQHTTSLDALLNTNKKTARVLLQSSTYTHQYPHPTMARFRFITSPLLLLVLFGILVTLLAPASATGVSLCAYCAPGTGCNNGNCNSCQLNFASTGGEGAHCVQCPLVSSHSPSSIW